MRVVSCFCFLMLLFAYRLNGQKHTFSSLAYNSVHSSSLASHGDHLYSIISSSQDIEGPSEVDWIYKMDVELNILDSIRLSSDYNTGDAIEVYSLPIYKDQHYLYCYQQAVLSPRDTSGCVRFGSKVWKLDKNLNILDTLLLESDSTLILARDAGIDTVNNKLYISGSLGECGEGYSTGLIKVDLNNFQWRGQILDTAIVRGGVFSRGIGVAKNRVFNFPAPFGQDFNDLIVSDTSLATIKKASRYVWPPVSPKRIFFNYGAAFFNYEGQVYLVGPVDTYFDTLPIFEVHYTLAIAPIDSNGQILRVDTFPHLGTQFRYGEWPGANSGWNSVDYRNKDSVVVGANARDWFGSEHVSEMTEIPLFVYNINFATGHLNWYRKITPGYSVGNVKVAALPGNKYALSFNQYEWSDPAAPRMVAHIWILDGQGGVVAQREWVLPSEKLSLYPQPANDRVYIKGLEIITSINYQIITMDGREIQSGRLEEPSIDVSSLEAGTYLLKIGNSVSRIMIDR